MPPTAVVMNMYYTGLGIARSLGARGVPRPSIQLTSSPLLERQIVVVRRRRVVERWTIPGGRRLAHGGRRASCGRRRVGARRAVARRPDDPFAPRAAALARLVPTLEVRRPRVALRRTVVPHRAAADGAEGHPIGVHSPTSRPRASRGPPRLRARGAAPLRARRRTRCRRRGSTRRPDYPAAAWILALEVGGLWISLPLAVVPHRALALGTGGDGRCGVWRGRLSHRVAAEGGRRKIAERASLGIPISLRA